MENIKSFGWGVLGITILIGFIVVIGLIFAFGSQLAFAIAPALNTFASYLLIFDVIVLLLAAIPSLRNFAGNILIYSSFVFGVSTWIFGLAITLSYWGWIAVIIGLFLGGVGVVPIGMLAAIFNGEWGMFGWLTFSLILTFAIRFIGAGLTVSAQHRQEKQSVLAIVEESRRNTAMNKERKWVDVE